MDLSGLDTDTIVTASPDIKMREVIEIRHQTCSPVALCQDGKMVGVVGDDEIYRGLLRQTRIAERPRGDGAIDADGMSANGMDADGTPLS